MKQELAFSAPAGHPRPSRDFDVLETQARRTSRESVRAQLGADQPLNIFAYGSLMWRCPFDVERTTSCRLDGFMAQMCVWTVRARGNLAHPGLGLGLLEMPGQCNGVVLQVDPTNIDAAMEALWEREMYTEVYAPTWLEVSAGAKTIRALGFAVNTGHPQYAGVLSVKEQAALIDAAHGELGSNLEYLANTVDDLDKYGGNASHLRAVLAKLH